MKEKGIPMRCTRHDCPKSEKGWNYKGAKRYPGSTSCPYCHKQIQIQIPKVGGCDSMKTIQDPLVEYEDGLRVEVEATLKIKLPLIPQTISSVTNILFLEQLLHENGYGKIEEEYRDAHPEVFEKRFGMNAFKVDEVTT